TAWLAMGKLRKLWQPQRLVHLPVALLRRHWWCSSHQCWSSWQRSSVLLNTSHLPLVRSSLFPQLLLNLSCAVSLLLVSASLWSSSVLMDQVVPRASRLDRHSFSMAFQSSSLPSACWHSVRYSALLPASTGKNCQQ